MLKGVHHQIVEIRQTEDPYFERALLFVRADCEEDVDWQERGHAFLDRAVPYTGLRRARLQARLRAVLFTVAGSVIGVLVGALTAQMR